MDEDYAELVLSAVEQIPPGQVASYGDIAEMVGRGGPRQVGHVMAHSAVRCPGGGWSARTAARRAAWKRPGLRLLRADQTPIKGDRVDMARARFTGDESGG